MPHHQTQETAERDELRQNIYQLANVDFLKTEFNDEAIRQLGDRIYWETKGTITSGAMRKWPKPCFIEGRKSIVKQFGLDKKSHFFHARPFEWVKLTEPQITKGIAHFLNEDNFDGNSARAKAFVKAFGITDFADTPHFRIQAEALSNTRERVDLQILWVGSDSTPQALIIEAKIEADIAEEQLANYVEYATKNPEINDDKARFFLLSPGQNAAHTKVLVNNPIWEEISWFKVMLKFQKFLSNSENNREFIRFCRTVWRHTYKNPRKKSV